MKKDLTYFSETLEAELRLDITFVDADEEDRKSTRLNSSH